MNRGPRSKFPALPCMVLSRKGSFDCVVARRASHNLAQDDMSLHCGDNRGGGRQFQ
jgi:hypothetical protein